MARTFNRVPNIIDLPDKRSLKKYFFNQYKWSGYNDDKNFVAVDQDSFSECENVYVDTEGVLRSRPYLKLKGKDGIVEMTQVDEVWEFGPVNVYRKGTTLYFVQGNDIKQAALTTTSCKLIIAHENIFIFEETNLQRYNLSTKTVSVATDFIYVPVTKMSSNGVTDDYESPNELTTSYYTRYIFNSVDDISFVSIYDKEVRMKVNGVEYNFTFKDGMQYSFMIDRHDLPTNSFADQYILGTGNDGYPLVDAITTPSGYNISLICTYVYDIGSNNVPNITWKMYWSLNDVEYFDLPEQTNIIGMPQLSKDGSMACVLKSDGLYVISLVNNEYGTLTYDTWYKLYTITIADHVTNTYTKPYNKNVVSSFVVKDSTTYAIIYSNSLYDGGFDTPSVDTASTKLRFVLNGTQVFDDRVVTIVSSATNLLDTTYCNSDTTGIYQYVTTNNDTTDTVYLGNNSSYYRIKYDTINDTVYLYSIGKVEGLTLFTSQFIYDNSPIILKITSSGTIKLLSSNEWTGGSYFIPTYSSLKTDFIVSNSVLGYTIADTYYNAYVYKNNNLINTVVNSGYSKFNPNSTSLNFVYIAGARVFKDDSQQYALRGAGGDSQGPKLIYYNGYRILLAGGNKLKNNDISDVSIYADVLTTGTYSLFIPEHTAELSEYYFSKGNTLYISKTNDVDNFKWYFPKVSTQNFDYSITNLHTISPEEVAIFQENNIYYVSWDSDLKAYRYYKSRVDIGLKEGSDVITTYDGKYTVFNTKRGLVAMSYQEFVASTEQALTYISDNIFTHYEKWVNNSPVKLCRYKYWIIAYRIDSQFVLVFDLRNNSWWPFKYAYSPSQFIVLDDELVILLNDRVYTNNKDDETPYKDYLDTNVDIEWFIKSQKLHLDALNYYKEIQAITLNNTFNDDVDLDNELRNKKRMKFQLKVKLFRTDIGQDSYGSIVQQGAFDSDDYVKVITYDIDCISTFVQRVNFMKVLEFQFELYNANDQFDRIPLSLANVTVKYKLGSQVR